MFYKNRLFLILSSLTIPFIFTNYPTLAQEKQEPSLSVIAQQQNSQIEIKEEDVENLIKNTNKALENQNVAEILAYFTPFTYSEVTWDTDDKSETLKINGLEEHRQYLQDSFAKIKDSEVLFDDYQISFSNDGAIAYVYRTRVINLTMNDGRKIIVSSKGKTRLAMVSGELKIISIEQNSDIDLRPKL